MMMIIIIITIVIIIITLYIVYCIYIYIYNIFEIMSSAFPTSFHSYQLCRTWAPKAKAACAWRGWWFQRAQPTLHPATAALGGSSWCPRRQQKYGIKRGATKDWRADFERCWTFVFRIFPLFHMFQCFFLPFCRGIVLGFRGKTLRARLHSRWAKRCMKSPSCWRTHHAWASVGHHHCPPGSRKKMRSPGRGHGGMG